MKLMIGLTLFGQKLPQYDWGHLLVLLGIGTIKVVLLYLLFIILKALANKVIERIFKTYEGKKNVSAGRVQTLLSLTKNIVGYVIIFIFVVSLLQIFGIQVTAILAGAGIIGLAVGFGAQGLVSDVVTGFFILLEKQMDIGDYVTASTYEGIVEEVGLRTTHIRGFDGTLHYVPNREIIGVSNHSRGNMRALVDISVSYDDDIDHAMAVIQKTCDEIASQNDNILEGPNVIGVQTLGSSDVVLRVIAKTKNMEQWGVQRQMLKEIKYSLDEHHIDIPFPHQVNIMKN